MAEAARDPARTSTRPTAAARSSARRWAPSTSGASAWSSTRGVEIVPALGGEGVHLQPELRLPRPGRRGARQRPRLPGVHGRAAARRTPSRCCCRSSRSGGSRPTSTPSIPRTLERARLLFLNYPNNPTGAVVPDGLFERAVEFARRTTCSSCTTTPTPRSPSTATWRRASWRRRGAMDVGVEVFSLSKGYNMTGWRCAAIVGNADAVERLLAAQDEHRLGHVRGGPAGRRSRRSTSPQDSVAEMCAIYRAAATSSRRAPRDRRRDRAAEGHDLRVGARPGGPDLRPPSASTCSRSRRRRRRRRGVRAERRGLLPHLADGPGRAPVEAVERRHALESPAPRAPRATTPEIAEVNPTQTPRVGRRGRRPPTARAIVNPRARQRAPVCIATGAGGRRALRAQGAAANGRRGGGRRAGPAPPRPDPNGYLGAASSPS